MDKEYEEPSLSELEAGHIRSHEILLSGLEGIYERGRDDAYVITERLGDLYRQVVILTIANLVCLGGLLYFLLTQ